MELLYGTSNQAKLEHMREMLTGLDIEIMGLQDAGINLDIDESGSSPLENARIKAMAYYQATGQPTFSCDSGLYIEGLEDKRQPGVYVRRIDNKYLDDEETIIYYAGLAAELGGETGAKFKNAICLVMDEDHIYQYDGDDIADKFILTAEVYHKRRPGFPLDSISKDIETGRYLLDLGNDHRNEIEITRGFRDFFIRTLQSLKYEEV